MADVTVKILEEAIDFKLMSVDECKLALGVTGGTNDEQLDWLIRVNSSTISVLCNRVFAKEKVRETWRCLQPRRVYLTHWPVREDDIDSVKCNGVDNVDWELEEGSGKLSIFSGRTEPIVVEYTGGYDLPQEAPFALKQACALLVGASRAEQSQAAVTGIRMIAHKESRVMFHSPNQSSGGGGVGAGGNSGARTAAESILNHFIRHWV